MMSVLVGVSVGPEVKKFEQVSSNGHQMSVAVDRGEKGEGGGRGKLAEMAILTSMDTLPPVGVWPDDHRLKSLMSN